jgi:hypothetical protein
MNGIKAICDFVRTAKSDPSHELARGLLVSLGRGSKASDALDHNLIELLHSDEPQVQRTAANVLRQLLSPAKVEGVRAAAPPMEIVAALHKMFASTQVHVQYEAQELGLLTLAHSATSAAMVENAVAMLRPEPYNFTSRRLHTPSDAELYGGAVSDAAIFDDAPPPESLLRQSSAARLIASYVNSTHKGPVLADSVDPDTVIEYMIEEGAVHNLLATAANNDFPDSKKYGAMALSALIKKSHEADQMLYKLTGPSFHRNWHADPSGCVRNLDYNVINQLFWDTGHPQFQYFKDGNRPAHPPQPQTTEDSVLREGDEEGAGDDHNGEPEQTHEGAHEARMEDREGVAHVQAEKS